MNLHEVKKIKQILRGWFNVLDELGWNYPYSFDTLGAETLVGRNFCKREKMEIFKLLRVRPYEIFHKGINICERRIKKTMQFFINSSQTDFREFAEVK